MIFVEDWERVTILCYLSQFAIDIPNNIEIGKSVQDDSIK